MCFYFLSYFSLLKGWYWLRSKKVSWFIKWMNLQTILCLSCLKFSWGWGWGWLTLISFFIIMKGYVKVNFKKRYSNNNNNCVYSSEPKHNIQAAPLKYWVYKILKSETNFAETATQFTTHWSSGNWSDIEKELETGIRLKKVLVQLD